MHASRPRHQQGAAIRDRVQCRRPGNLAAPGATFPGIEASVLDGEAQRGASGDPGVGGLGKRALTTPGVDGRRPFGDPV